MDILNWIAQISQSTTPGRGFHPQWIYIVFSVFVPATIGAMVTLCIMLLEKVFNIRIGGGH